MVIEDFLQTAPKVELHVHLEGSIRPETLLELARTNLVDLPASSIDGLREWYHFRDFPHFVDIYVKISECVKTSEDVELVAREFLQGQADQKVLHTEATFTMWTLRRQSGISLDDQLAAVNRARSWAERELGVSMGLVLDIVREESVEDGLTIAEFAIVNHGNGICALGLTGEEPKNEPKKHAEAFHRARDAGLPITCHAGETAGAWSIRGALHDLDADRIGHGIRCLEDPELVTELRERQIHLEVCPSSNVCLGLTSSLEDHPLIEMLNEGLNVSINSDDPPMFNTSMTEELRRCASAFGFNKDVLWTLTHNAARAAFLPDEAKKSLIERLRAGYAD